MIENKTLFVTGFPNDVTVKEHVQELFSPYGKLTRVDYFYNKNIAFVEYESPEAANFAIYSLNGTPYKYGTKLKVNWARKKEDENKKKEDDEQQQTEQAPKETTPTEPKVTEIERPDTPVGFELATKPTPKPTGTGTGKKKNKKNKSNVAREIQHPTVPKPQQQQETQTTSPSTGGQKQQRNQNNQQVQNTNQPPQGSPTTGGQKQQRNQNQPQKRNQNNPPQNEQQSSTPPQNTKKTQNKKQSKKNVTTFEVVIRNTSDRSEVVVATYNDSGSQIVDSDKYEELMSKFNR